MSTWCPYAPATPFISSVRFYSQNPFRSAFSSGGFSIASRIATMSAKYSCNFVASGAVGLEAVNSAR